MLEDALDQSGNGLRVLIAGAIAGVLYWTYIDIWDISWLIPYYIPLVLLVTVSWYYDIVRSLKVFGDLVLKIARSALAVCWITGLLLTLIDRFLGYLSTGDDQLATQVISLMTVIFVVSFFLLQILAIYTIIKRVYRSPRYILFYYVLAIGNLNLIPFGILFYQAEIERLKRHFRKGGLEAQINQIGQPKQ